MSDWDSYQKSILRYPELGFTLDCSRMGAPEGWSQDLQGKIARAFRDLVAIEAGAIMNPDEGRAVGHYWLRKPEIAPAAEGQWIRDVNEAVTSFAAKGPDGRGRRSQWQRLPPRPPRRHRRLGARAPARLQGAPPGQCADRPPLSRQHRPGRDG
jgi:hypothetical protein